MGGVFPAGESDSAIFGSPEMVAGEPGDGQLTIVYEVSL